MGLPEHPVRRSIYASSSSLLSSIASLALGIYQATLEIEIQGEERLLKLQAQGKNILVAVWHTFVDAAVFGLHSRGLLIYTDHPRTSEYEESLNHYVREVGIKTLRSFGFDVLDASLGKQSAGIVNFIKGIRAGKPALLAPDGPSGPVYRAKPGAIYMAQKSGGSVLPVGFGFSRFIIGPNWDDFALPLPFSRMVMIFGEPITPPPGLDGEGQAEYALRLEQELDRLNLEAGELARRKKKK